MHDPQQVVDQIARAIGLVVPAPVNWSLVSHIVQRDESSTDWRQRFLAETGDEFRTLVTS
jgi:hypothetical protein